MSETIGIESYELKAAECEHIAAKMPMSRSVKFISIWRQMARNGAADYAASTAPAGAHEQTDSSDGAGLMCRSCHSPKWS